jgi:hypothetical protein
MRPLGRPRTTGSHVIGRISPQGLLADAAQVARRPLVALPAPRVVPVTPAATAVFAPPRQASSVFLAQLLAQEVSDEPGAERSFADAARHYAGAGRPLAEGLSLVV